MVAVVVEDRGAADVAPRHTPLAEVIVLNRPAARGVDLEELAEKEDPTRLHPAAQAVVSEGRRAMPDDAVGLVVLDGRGPIRDPVAVRVVAEEPGADAQRRV